MSEQTAEAVETTTDATTEQQDDAKATETVEHWREIARKQEKRAKENADAAKRLAELEDAKKSETEKAADRIAKAEAEVASVPAKVADALKSHLVALHEISDDDAELFLTASDPELLLKQVTRLIERNTEAAKDAGKPRAPKPDPNQGRTPNGHIACANAGE